MQKAHFCMASTQFHANAASFSTHSAAEAYSNWKMRRFSMRYRLQPLQQKQQPLSKVYLLLNFADSLILPLTIHCFRSQFHFARRHFHFLQTTSAHSPNRMPSQTALPAFMSHHRQKTSPMPRCIPCEGPHSFWYANLPDYAILNTYIHK